MHLNRNKSREIHYNSLKHFPLHGFNKHLLWFRCSGKGEHLNLLATNALQDLQQLHPWFRSLAGLEHHRLQIHSGGTSGRGFHQTRSRTAQASEPEQNPRNPLQHIEKLSIAKFQQASPLVQMQWKRRASEPCHKTESGSQPTHNKHIAELSVTVPVVQIPTWVGTQQNANMPWRHFWQGYSRKKQQDGPGI